MAEVRFLWSPSRPLVGLASMLRHHQQRLVTCLGHPMTNASPERFDRLIRRWKTAAEPVTFDVLSTRYTKRQFQRHKALDLVEESEGPDQLLMEPGDPVTSGTLARGGMQGTLPQLTLALTGASRDHHPFAA